MKYSGTLISVNNLEKSRRFYQDVLGLEIIADFGANVTLSGGIALQTMETWKSFIGNKDILLQNNAYELFFEEAEMDKFLVHLKSFDIDYVHEPLEYSWGQRAVRFYDPDNHMIEVGEDMLVVVKRFIDSGMTKEQTAIRMDVPITYIENCLNQSGGDE